MMSRFSLCAAALASSVCLTPAVFAAPPSINRLADKATLTDRNRTEIEDYATYWVAELSADEPDRVDKARDRLIDPLKAVQVGRVFRLEYSDALLQSLEGVIAAGRTHPAVNAMQIAGMLGTPDAFDLLMEHAHFEQQPDFAMRLWSANMLPIAVEQDVIPQNQLDRALRVLERAAIAEPDWLVLRRQLEAIGSVDTPNARDAQVRILQAIAAQMKAEQQWSERMQALYPALVRLRNDVLELEFRQLRDVGTELAPVLCDLCTVADRHWDSAQRDNDARKAYGGTVNVSERMLQFIDANVRDGARLSTKLGSSWQNKRQQEFRADHDKWQNVLSREPYAKAGR